ncbi:hypothetical protein DL98DRAFT_656281 [Cadophora sp. DSE1049]|nr:hypothetical protein DL98DRAFT_656281 [Cadophora sp. DSE1049]
MDDLHICIPHSCSLVFKSTSQALKTLSYTPVCSLSLFSLKVLSDCRYLTLNCFAISPHPCHLSLAPGAIHHKNEEVRCYTATLRHFHTNREPSPKMARLTTTLPYALFTVLLLLFLSSLASAKTNGTAMTNGTYTKPTHTPPTTYITGKPKPIVTPTPSTTDTPAASSTGTGTQPTEAIVTAGVPLSYSGTGSSLFGALAVGALVGLGLELGL